MTETTTNQLEIEKILGLLDTAKGAILKQILTKLKNEQPLSAQEIRTLKEFESEYKARQQGAGRRLVASVKEVAEYLGKSSRMISYYKSQGLPVNPDGTYDLDAVDAWEADRRSKGIGQPHNKPESGDKALWDTQYREFKARLAELDYQKAIAEVLPRQEVIRGRVLRITEVCSKLMGLSRKLPPFLEGKEKRDMEAILFEEFYNLCETFSRPGSHEVRINKKDLPFIRKILKTIHPLLTGKEK